MNNRDRSARDPRPAGKTLRSTRPPRAHSEDDVAGDLASFVSEATLPDTSVKSGPSRHPLWEFPEEGSPAVAASDPANRKSSIYAPLAAALFGAAVAGAWWGGFIPTGRPVAIGTTAEAVVSAPAVTPPAAASTQPPAQLIPSLEVEPSARTPVASIVPAVPREEPARLASLPPRPVALAGAMPERRQPPERIVSMARGTSGSAPTAPISTLGPRTLTVPMPTTPMAMASPAVRMPAPELLPALEPTPAVVPQASPKVPAPGPAMRPEPVAVPAVVARTEQGEIQRTLGQYRNAYELLDAEAARVVWPSVDVRALARAFDSLTSQQLAFESCQFDITGPAATAQCRGSATYTPKVGSRDPKLESRQWTFQLRKVDEGWKIQSAQTRR